MRNQTMTTHSKSRISMLLGAIALGSTVSGCFYYDDRDDDYDDGYTYCDDTGCWYCDDYGCYPDDGNGGFGSCVTNYDCAAGCYCSADGVCVEAGFCSSDADCPAGMVCDDRASCVPEGTGGCTSDADCPFGSFCDGGVCVGSGTCTSDAECGPGMTCDDRGTCVPTPCTSDDQCLEGCYCDEATGECVESGTCTSDADCGEGMVCDEARGTCEPCDGDCPVDTGNCYETVTCADAAPSCPAGTLPGVSAGCYTGYCVPEALCPDEPPWTCADATSEAECTAAPGCEAVYIGVNCTNPMGGTCMGSEPDCTCEYFEYGFCRDL
jgi:hypothetical protein